MSLNINLKVTRIILRFIIILALNRNTRQSNKRSIGAKLLKYLGFWLRTRRTIKIAIYIGK